jgi:hypothetical protein
MFYQPSNVASAVGFVLSHQNTDGGFRDTIRSSAGSNALDTGWAAIALQLAGLFGDANLDGTVDIIDLAIIAFAYQATPTSPNWIPHADVDGNGVVNIIDIAIAAFYFDKTADSL